MAEFDAILQQSIDRTTSYIIAALVGFLALEIFFAFRLKRIIKRLQTQDMSKRDYNRCRDHKVSMILSICLIPILLIVLSLGSYQRITHLKNDIAHQQYICVEADYSYRLNGNNEKKVTITHDAKTVSVSLPENHSEDDFPLGRFHGTAWYSKESRILLSFTPDEEKSN